MSSIFFLKRKGKKGTKFNNTIGVDCPSVVCAGVSGFCLHPLSSACIVGDTSRNSSIHDVIPLDVFSFVIEQTTSMTKRDRFVIGLRRWPLDTTQL
jgi:hypothetical protein